MPEYSPDNDVTKFDGFAAAPWRFQPSTQYIDANYGRSNVYCGSQNLTLTELARMPKPGPYKGYGNRFVCLRKGWGVGRGAAAGGAP